MKLEWLVTNVAGAGSPARAESRVFCASLDIFAKLGNFCGWEATL